MAVSDDAVELPTNSELESGKALFAIAQLVTEAARIDRKSWMTVGTTPDGKELSVAVRSPYGNRFAVGDSLADMTEDLYDLLAAATRLYRKG